MNKALVYFLTFAFSGLFTSAFAQQKPLSIRVSGMAVDARTGFGLPGLMVLNKRTGYGFFGGHTGEFEIKALKSDTILFSVIGYATEAISFVDSVFSEEYHIRIKMKEIKVELQHLNVFPSRGLEEIKKDIDELGVKYQYQVEGLAGLQSPVTFLYERFSRFEKQRKKAAELYNEEAKKDILKELFRKYIKAEIIDLDEKEFEAFLMFCNLPEQFIKTATQFELVMAIKSRYEAYKWLKNNEKE